MKKVLLTIAMVLLVIAFAACNRDSDNTSAEVGNGGTIMSIGPVITEVLVDLGLGDRIIAADNFSAMIPGVPSNLELVVDMWMLDVEAILALEPDIVIATDMIMFGGDPLSLVAQAGTRVVYVPVSSTIDGIIENIHYIANEMGVPAEANPLVATMETDIAAVRAIAEGIENRRTVYFEIDMGPPMFTFGAGTFLHEILEIVGAVNIFADYGAWVAVADEQILARDPDVIITNDAWTDDPIGIIKGRPGWYGLSAVANNRVHHIDADTTSRDNHHIISAMHKIARAIYPEYFS